MQFHLPHGGPCFALDQWPSSWDVATTRRHEEVVKFRRAIWPPFCACGCSHMAPTAPIWCIRLPCSTHCSHVVNRWLPYGTHVSHMGPTRHIQLPHGTIRLPYGPHGFHMAPIWHRRLPYGPHLPAIWLPSGGHWLTVAVHKVNSESTIYFTVFGIVLFESHRRRIPHSSSSRQQ
jgi:hypothetical protein